MKKYGCIGKRLTHSFSREIHARLADYEYDLIELEEDQLPSFLEKREFNAVNVTIPYKQAVIPYLDSVSDVARRIGAVNTVVNREGRLYGYNTDYYGMKALIERVGIDPCGKKTLILGTGGTGRTARAVAMDMGASEVLTVSRRRTDEYIDYSDAVADHSDAQIIINTTPSGMYPDYESIPIDISGFYRLEGVIDAVYNPLRTDLVLDALERGIKAEGGLYMLVMQAVAAVEKFLDTKIPEDTAIRVYRDILASKENIVLTGMPGSGKSTVGRLLRVDGFETVDTDTEVEGRCGIAISKLIETRGEPYFRDIEAEVVRQVSRDGGRIISTGGGVILRKENVRSLKRNGRLFFIDAELSRLCADKLRPFSDTEDKLARLYNDRIDIYRSSADLTVPDMETAEAEARYIIEKRLETMI